MSKEKKGEGFARLIVTLFGITAVVALLLGVVNSITVDRIAENAIAIEKKAMETVMPGAESYDDIGYTGEYATSVIEASKGGEIIGYCVKVTVSGSQDMISLIVGVDADAVVRGVSIVAHSETAGLGSKADSSGFLDQYIGRTDTITVNTGENSIDGITAATVTSAAVTRGVNMAILAVAEVTGKPIDTAGVTAATVSAETENVNMVLLNGKAGQEAYAL